MPGINLREQCSAVRSFALLRVGLSGSRPAVTAMRAMACDSYCTRMLRHRPKQVDNMLSELYRTGSAVQY